MMGGSSGWYRATKVGTASCGCQSACVIQLIDSTDAAPSLARKSRSVQLWMRFVFENRGY